MTILVIHWICSCHMQGTAWPTRHWSAIIHKTCSDILGSSFLRMSIIGNTKYFQTKCALPAYFQAVLNQQIQGVTRTSLVEILKYPSQKTLNLQPLYCTKINTWDTSLHHICILHILRVGATWEYKEKSLLGASLLFWRLRRLATTVVRQFKRPQYAAGHQIHINGSEPMQKRNFSVISFRIFIML